MSKKPLAIIIFLVVAMVIVIIITVATSSTDTNKNQSLTNDKVTAPTPASTNSSATEAKIYSLTDVAKHSTKTDCWAAVNGGVYDLTSWIGKHPGGEKAIIGLCGKDGSEAFNGQHEGQDDPAKALASFRIGNLSK